MVLFLDVGVDVGVHGWVCLMVHRHIRGGRHSCDDGSVIDRWRVAIVELRVLQEVRVHGKQHHVVAVRRRVAVQWFLHQGPGELQALLFRRRRLGRVVVGGVDHPQHPHLAGVGTGDARVVVELVVDQAVLALFDALLVLLLRIQVGDQPVRTLVPLGVCHPLSLAGVLDGGPEQPRPLALEVHRLGFRRVDDNLALLRVVEHVFHVLDELGLAGERLDDLVLDVPALEHPVLGGPRRLELSAQLLESVELL